MNPAEGKKSLRNRYTPCTMLYFTYGSFMDIDNLRKHTPSAEFVCKALIPNWEVQFNYYSKNYMGGCTGIEPALNRLVRGTVYETPPDEMEYLDTVEGVPQATCMRKADIPRVR